MDDICIVNDDIFEGDEPVHPEPEGKYMTITVDSNSGETTISPIVTGNIPNLNLQYRVNNGNWIDFIVGTTEDIHVVAGDFVQFKGNNPDGLSVDYNNYLNFVISDNVHLSGSIMSLIDGIGECDTIPNSCCFYSLFMNSKIKTVSKYFLHATTLKDRCYYSLFEGCKALENTPELPSLTLEYYCYNSMFKNCTMLVQSPLLPATELKLECYSKMFQGCSNLQHVTCLATRGTYFPSASATSAWLNGVAKNGTLEKPSEAVYLTDSGSGIPSGWNVVDID